MTSRRWCLAVAMAIVLSACATGADEPPAATSTTIRVEASATTTTDQEETTVTTGREPGLCADVIDVQVTVDGAGTYRFDVTVRSPDTGWDKYADLWEVRGPDGTVFGERVLTHPHVDEQPFTRSESGITIPDAVSSVTVVARDSVTGFCGEGFQVDVP